MLQKFAARIVVNFLMEKRYITRFRNVQGLTSKSVLDCYTGHPLAIAFDENTCSPLLPRTQLRFCPEIQIKPTPKRSAYALKQLQQTATLTQYRLSV